MAYNYCDTTGVLVLNKVTPVIKALFGVFDLDETEGGPGRAYIANISESSNCNWDEVFENLIGLAKDLNLELDQDLEPSIENVLEMLSTHFGADEDENLHGLIERFRFEDDTDLTALFCIAQAFDDGHGLTAIKTETSWHCSEPRLFEFGGAGQFIGRHANVYSDSGQSGQIGSKMEEALSAGNLDGAVKVTLDAVNQLLAGINDPEKRKSVQLRLAQLLAV